MSERKNLSEKEAQEYVDKVKEHNKQVERHGTTVVFWLLVLVIVVILLSRYWG